ncbi:hypothetical protein D1B31_15750 [Neobacillus notoginsengisoli]|uniref:Lipoprotein n=1 Tax=Neobacillus notoginsengisoli TaxID=1578198 RepID=A0A417YQV8_9BACI|nr:hypothetical protein [Neobacillus notoginsengisoli]RHW37225.1 hypothetical protein D1B31_15750 [Neobacillus notoginsengisoli]
MRNKLFILFAGLVCSVFLLGGCGTNNDEQNPPPQDNIRNDQRDMENNNNNNDPNIQNDGRVDEDGLLRDTDNGDRVNPNRDEGLMRDNNGNRLDLDLNDHDHKRD